jgi:ABC-type antimicrobial peptide transport system permease subunit
MEQHIAASVLPQRIAGSVLSVFGLVAVLLVSVGVYGVVAYAVATRTREIGVRIALGAQPSDARWFVIRQGVKLVAIGVIIALPVAWASMRLLTSFLVGASASDPVAFVGTIGILGVVAMVATYFPARRASLIDPMVALRSD